jgi:DNA-directed RNA polymerase specialized sigma subunit
MHALDETDRTAVLLRYFENKSLREVGAALGASENAFC